MFREPNNGDWAVLIQLMDEFYHSDAVLHPIPMAYFQRTIQALKEKSPFVKAYLIQSGQEIAGYCLLAVTWSNEAGGIAVWVEELYIRPAFQGQGLGKSFFEFLHREWEGKAVRFRLETEEENQGARRLYGKIGYEDFRYLQMVREASPDLQEK